MSVDIEKLRKKLYAGSPFDLCTAKDNAYRDGVDMTLEMVNEQINKGA